MCEKETVSSMATDLATKYTVAAILRTINQEPTSSTGQHLGDEGRKTPPNPQRSTFRTQVPQ